MIGVESWLCVLLVFSSVCVLSECACSESQAGCRQVSRRCLLWWWRWLTPSVAFLLLFSVAVAYLSSICRSYLSYFATLSLSSSSYTSLSVVSVACPLRLSCHCSPSSASYSFPTSFLPRPSTCTSPPFPFLCLAACCLVFVNPSCHRLCQGTRSNTRNNVYVQQSLCCTT